MDLRSGTSYWQHVQGQVPVYPPLDHDERADVAVVGAGVTGALVAQRLTESGADVVVVDRRAVACGSTLATTGLLLYDTDTSLREIAGHYGLDTALRVYQLGLEATGAIEELSADAGGCGFSRRPSVYLASDPADIGPLQEEWRLREAHGFDVTWLDRDGLEDRYGIDGAGAILGQGNAQIDAARFTHAMIRRAVSAGARVYDATEVVAVHDRGDGVTIETAGGPTVTASRMVWASGYEGAEPSTRRLARRYSTWVLASEPLDDLGQWHDGALFWETARPYLYARLTDDRRVIVGGADRPFHWWHTSPWLMQRKTARLQALIGQRFPHLRLEIAFRWAGVFSTTADGLPYVGEVAGHPRRWLAFGYGGNGITFSLIAANLIRDAWIGRHNPDAAIFRIGR